MRTSYKTALRAKGLHPMGQVVTRSSLTKRFDHAGRPIRTIDATELAMQELRA